MDNHIIFAFDIEGLGVRPQMIIAIGATILSKQTRKRVAQGLWVYAPLPTLDAVLANGVDGVDYDASCIEEFWRPKPTLYTRLQAMTNTSSMKEMVASFLTFWKRWEQIARDNLFYFETISDNLLYDGHVVNSWIDSDFPEFKPLPYRLNKSLSQHRGPHFTYGNVLDCRAFEAAIDIVYRFSLVARELRIFPPLLNERSERVSYKYSHIPSEDAHCIASKYAHYCHVIAKYPITFG